MELRFPKEKVVGLKQTRKSLEKGEAKQVFLASDADPMLLEPIEKLCESTKVPVDRRLSMAELGKACGISVGTATCAILISVSSEFAL